MTPYQRAIYYKGQTAVNNYLDEWLKNDPSTSKVAFIPELKDLEKWVNKFKVHPRYASRGGKKGLKKPHVDQSRTMTIEDIKGKSRVGEIIVIRYCIIKYFKEYYSLKRIGGMIRKNHTTIMHGLDTFNFRLEVNDKEYTAVWNSLQEFLKQNN